jgi:hypothetical protein
MARHGQQLIDHSRVGGRLMSADLAWAWAVPHGTGEEPASGRQVSLLRDQHVDDLSDGVGLFGSALDGKSSRYSSPYLRLIYPLTQPGCRRFHHHRSIPDDLGRRRRCHW